MPDQDVNQTNAAPAQTAEMAEQKTTLLERIEAEFVTLEDDLDEDEQKVWAEIKALCAKI